MSHSYHVYIYPAQYSSQASNALVHSINCPKLEKKQRKSKQHRKGNKFIKHILGQNHLVLNNL